MYYLVDKIFEKFNKFSPIIFMSPNFRSFGNAAEEIFYGILLSKRLNKKILFVFPRIGLLSVSNRELYYLEHQNIISHKSILSLSTGVIFEIYVLILWLIDFIKCSSITRNIFTFLGCADNKFLQKDYGYIIPTIGKEKLWVPCEVVKFSTQKAKNLNWSEQYSNYEPPLINTKKMNKGSSILETIGLPKNQWFVCLHVREKKDTREIRNTEIKNYLNAIKYIISKGGFVIRIGDIDSPPLPKINNLIDYTQSRNRSSLIDLIIINKCRFILGTSSGPNMVAHLFNKDVLGTNLTEWSHSISFCKKSILKHFFSKNKNKVLSVREMLHEPYHIQRIGNTPNEDYNLIDNSSEEISLLVKSELDDLASNSISVHQAKFDKIKLISLLKHLKNGEPKNWHGLIKHQHLIQQYRFYAMSMYDGMIEKNFLDRNW